MTDALRLPNASRARNKLRTRSPFPVQENIDSPCRQLHANGAIWQTGESVSLGGCMRRLTELSRAEKKFIDDAVAEAERIKGKKLNRAERHIVLNRARAQIQSARYAARKQAEREEERHQAEFTWSKPTPLLR